MKRIVGLILVIGIILSMSAVAATSSVTPQVTIFGASIQTEGLAFIEDGKVVLPLRAVAEGVGAVVGWDNATKSITIKSDKINALVKIGRKEVLVNGKTVLLTRVPVIKNSRTVVSMKFVSTILGEDIRYDFMANKAIITRRNFEEKVKITYASGFSIDNLGNGSKLVTDGDDQKFLLVPKGNIIPSGYENAILVRTPIDNVFLGSSTYACALNALGLVDSIGGVTSDAPEWYIPEVKSGIENGSIKFVGQAFAPDFEKIRKIDPEIAFVYTGLYPQTNMIDKFKELGITYAVNNEYMETTTLGRLEWMKFEAAFYNKDSEAKVYFDEEVNKINKLKSMTKGLNGKKVVWASIYKGVVYVPNAGSYVAEMIEAAGGVYAFEDLGTSRVDTAKLTLEEFYVKAKDADVLIYASTYGNSIQDIIDQAPILEDIKSIKDGNAYKFHLSWFQTIDKTADKYINLANILYPNIVDKVTRTQNYIKLK